MKRSIDAKQHLASILDLKKCNLTLTCAHLLFLSLHVLIRPVQTGLILDCSIFPLPMYDTLQVMN